MEQTIEEFRLHAKPETVDLKKETQSSTAYGIQRCPGCNRQYRWLSGANGMCAACERQLEEGGWC